MKIKYYILFLFLFLLPSALFAEGDLERYRSGARSFIDLSLDNPYLPIIISIGLIFAIATFYIPRFGLIVMLLFILFATDMPIGKNGAMGRAITIRLEDIILLLVSGGWLLNRAKTKSLAVMKNTPIFIPVLIMALAIIFASLIGFFQETVSPLRAFFFSLKRLEYFWIFFMVYNILETDFEAKVALKIFFGISVVLAFISFTQFFFFPVSELTKGGATAAAGFGRANTMADFLLIILGLSLGLLIFAGSKTQFFLYSFFVALFASAIILTKSRGAYVSIPPLLFAIFAISKNKKALWVLGTGILAVGLYFLILNFNIGSASALINKHHDEISEQFTQIGDVAREGLHHDPSLRSRIISWQESIKQIIDYPLFGQGCGAKKLGYSDNQYVRELLETGIIGFCAFIFMNLSIFLFMLRLYLTTDNTLSKGLSLGFIGGHAGMMVHGVTMSNFYTIINMEVFWFILAVISIFYYNEHKKRLSDDRLDDNIIVSDPVTLETSMEKTDEPQI